jgi:hypothetical protein
MATCIADVEPYVAAPDGLNVDQAHRLMQAHLRCQVWSCAERAAALDVLVRTGRYVLASEAVPARA